MKKLIPILIALIIVFVGIWIIKVNIPAKNTQTPTDSEQLYWWDIAPGEVPTADPEWVLPTTVNGNPVPDNYIPMLNQKNLYMVIDENGNIQSYRRANQEADGTWYWTTVDDPNIPENYIAVEGLDNVYLVENADGTEQYMKYVRNDDNSYFFTEVDKDGNLVDAALPDGVDIPQNFVRISGNIFGMYNEYGVLTGYAERSLDNATGEFSWEFCDEPLDTSLPDISTPNVGDVPTPEQPGTPSGSGGTIEGDLNIITGQNKDGGYTETKTTTSIEHKDGWVYVYETVLTLTYDKNGDLYSTKKEGPTLINQYPETEINQEIGGD